MIPVRFRDLQSAFVAAMLAVTAATQAYLANRVPLWSALFGLTLVGAFAMGSTLLLLVGSGFHRNRLRRAIEGGRGDVRRRVADFVGRYGRSLREAADGPVFLDDPAPVPILELCRDLGRLGLRLGPAEVMEYLLVRRPAPGRLPCVAPPERAWSATRRPVAAVRYAG